jgi:hypothetical protein
MNMAEGFLNTPKDLADYVGKFVVFFSDEENPSVLFHTPISEEAYKKAEELAEKFKKQPVVMRIQENPQNNIAQLLSTRAHA